MFNKFYYAETRPHISLLWWPVEFLHRAKYLMDEISSFFTFYNYPLFASFLHWCDKEVIMIFFTVEAPPRKNQSAVWLFYKKVDGYAVCKTCGTFMRYNKIRHLQKRHPTVYRKWQSIRKENNEFKLLAKGKLY